MKRNNPTKINLIDIRREVYGTSQYLKIYGASAFGDPNATTIQKQALDFLGFGSLEELEQYLEERLISNEKRY